MTASTFQAYGVRSSGVRRVALIGAGAMGSGIAAQFANAGVPVDLLDIANDQQRDGPARAGIAQQLNVGGFMHPDAAHLIRPGNIEDDLERLAEADWIIEAIVERLDVKRDLYRRLQKVCKADAIISSNTSTLSRADLVEGASAKFDQNFLITHFFNPPRIMQLVELVVAPQNSSELVARTKNACETILGKSVVQCRDTPGFIANRIGCFWIAAGILEAKNIGLVPEEADAVMRVLGVPRTGVFALADLVGLDLVPHVWGSLMDCLPTTDAIHHYDLPNDQHLSQLIQSGRLGRKSKAGYFRLDAQKNVETFDFETGDYRPSLSIEISSLPGGGRDLAALTNADDKFGKYARCVLSAVVAYVAENAAQITDDVVAIDDALRLGYGWKEGPCRLADRVGVKKISEWLEADGRPVPLGLQSVVAQGGFYDAEGRPFGTDGKSSPRHKADQRICLSRAKATGAPIVENSAASLWDLGDGVACFEIHTKVNSFVPEVFDCLEQTLDRGGRDFEALILGNAHPRAFSAGADLASILEYVSSNNLGQLDAYIGRGQALFSHLRFADFPSVAAMHGLALGGGCEFGLHASRIVAHAELSVGLPEVLVGLVPGWGGCTQLLVNAQQVQIGAKGPVARAQRVFDSVFAGARSSSALDARANGIVRHQDIIVMRRNSLLDVAKAVALEMLGAGYRAPKEILLELPGPSGKNALMSRVYSDHKAGRLSKTDVVIAEALATIVTGGPDADLMRPINEREIMDLERNTLIALAKLPTTTQRIAYMLKSGKPLKN